MGFDAAKAVEATTKWIRDWFEMNGPGCNAIVGISGGKDSSIAAALCCEALGKDRVIGVLMPNGDQSDIDMAKLLVDHLGIEHYIINIKSAFDGLTEQIAHAGIEISKDPPSHVDTLRCRPEQKWQSSQHMQSFRRLGRILDEIR